MTRSAVITYDGLPISSGGAHKLRTRGFVDGLRALQSFVTAVSLDPRPRQNIVEVSPKTRYAGYAAVLHVTWNLVFGDASRRLAGQIQSHFPARLRPASGKYGG